MRQSCCGLQRNGQISYVLVLFHSRHICLFNNFLCRCSDDDLHKALISRVPAGASVRFV